EGTVLLSLTTRLGPVELRTPLVAASGTVGSVVEMAGVADLSVYGAAVAKSVSREPWPGRPAPRLAPIGVGMLNGVGIQNPGIEAWVEEVGPRLANLEVPVWGSAVGTTTEEFAHVAEALARAGVAAVEVNLSCPNLEGDGMFALDAGATRKVVEAVRHQVSVPVAAKLSPNAERIAGVATAAAEAGADWVVLTNTVWGAGIDVGTRRPLLSGGIGGYSGAPLKPIALRCVMEVREALPDLPILGCGGIATGRDVVEYLLAGASAVAIGTVHFAEPRAGRRILGELRRECRRQGVETIVELIGAVRPW
ncbi:MAG: dihydroorotate dehydrogenase, partial [Acidimicrobiia bacterium]